MTGIPLLLRKHQRFLLLVLLYLVAVIATQATLPVLEGTADEQFHLNYVLWLQGEKRLPDRTTYVSNTMQQESGQPPLTYWVAATTLDLLGIPAYHGNPLNDVYESRNLWFTPPDWARRTDNFNYFFHGENEQAFKHPQLVLADRIGRLLSLLYGLVAIVAAYNAIREVVWRQS